MTGAQETGTPELRRVRLTAMSPEGRAVGRDDGGKVVFAEGGVPGDEVEVAISADHPTYSSGRVTAVTLASRHRVEAPCRRFGQGCGGCQWQHVDPEAQRLFKTRIVEDCLRRLGGTDVAVGPTVGLDPWGYRTTVRAAVVDGRPAFRGYRSHSTVPACGCPVVHPLLAELLEGRRYASAREVLLRCGVRTGDRLVCTRPRHSEIDVPAGVERSALREQAAGRTWRISAGSFFQVRPDGADALAGLVLDAAQRLGGDRALDLYSGVGLFAGVLADAGWKVTAVEGDRSAVADARENLRGTGTNVVRADVTRWTPPGADLVVADPSRAGLGARGVATVAAAAPERVVLVSCDAASLGRDAGLLRRAGFRCSSVTPVDLFPQTFHVEVVSVFDRA